MKTKLTVAQVAHEHGLPAPVATALKSYRAHVERPYHEAKTVALPIQAWHGAYFAWKAERMDALNEVIKRSGYRINTWQFKRITADEAK